MGPLRVTGILVNRNRNGLKNDDSQELYFLLSRILSQLLDSPLKDPFVQIIFKKIYENLMEEIDAIDNGIDVCSEGTPKYLVSTTLSHRVGR